MRKHLYILFLTVSILAAGCKDKGVNISEEFQIMKVEVTSDPVTSSYTAVFTAIPENSLEQPHRFVWQLQQPGGGVLDTLTETPSLYWMAPEQTGSYAHALWIESEDGKVRSQKYSFSVQVVPWQPPPADPGFSGKIVFSAWSDSNDTYQIFSMNADGGNLQQLTDFDHPWGDSFSPSWSADGQQIVFASGMYGTSHNPALWVMDADGGNQRLVQPGEEAHHSPLLGNYPRWSPDGEKIVYSIYDGFQVDIYIYDFTTGQSTQLTSHRADDSSPDWSPDGNRIIFRSKRDYNDYNHDLYIINLDGTGLRRITRTGYIAPPVWGPDGRTVVYRSTDGLYQLDLQTGVVTNLKADISDRTPIYPHAWAPDGKKLLVSTRELDPPRENAISVFNTRNNNLKYIYTQQGFNSNPVIMGADLFVPKIF